MDFKFLDCDSDKHILKAGMSKAKMGWTILELDFKLKLSFVPKFIQVT